MSATKAAELEARARDYRKMTEPEREQFRKDLAVLARSDLRAASRLVRDNIHDQVARRELPTVVRAADEIDRHFRDKRQERVNTLVYTDRTSSQDPRITLQQPDDRSRYKGPVVGMTADLVVQQVRDRVDTYIVHDRRALSGLDGSLDQSKDVEIAYPFKGVGGLAVVASISKNSFEVQGREHSAEARKSIEMSR